MCAPPVSRAALLWRPPVATLAVVLLAATLVSSAGGCFRYDATVQPNARPIAAAEGELTAAGGETVVLDGSSSSDPDGDALRFRWSQVLGEGTPVALSGADTAAASFVAPDSSQRLYFQLVVDDEIEESTPAVVLVDVHAPPNQPPVAAAAAEQVTALAGETVVLDGSDSADPEGAQLAFSWTQVEGTGEPVNLLDANQASASFTAPAAAQALFFRLVVSDGVQQSLPAVVRVEVHALPNERPLAVTEHLLQVAPGATVVLDGSASGDLDEDPLTFSWSQIEGNGEPVNLIDADQAVASFVAPERDQTLFFRLVVNDGLADSAPVVARVEILTGLDGPPVAVAPEELSATVGDTVVLDGSDSSDPEGARLSYRWEQIQGAGDPVRIDSPSSAVASFVAPDRGQTLFFRLTVSDGLHEGEPAITRVRVNGPPVADAGAPREVLNQSSLLLDGSASHDPDGGAIAAFLWRVDSAPAAAGACLEEPSPCLDGAASVAPTFTPPAKGDYLVSLVVGDGVLDSLPHAVVVRSLNRAPLAVAAADRVSAPNTQTVNLDGSDSEDPDGDPIAAYHWEVLSLPPGATAQLNPPDGAVADPELTLGGRGSYFLSLTVTDSDGARSAGATVRIDALNNSPEANPGAARVVPTGTEVALLGRGTDLDGDPLQYRWTLVDWPAGGQVSLTDADGANVRFTPLRKTTTAEPAQCGDGECYVLELQVSDGEAWSEARRVVVTATNRPPVADAGPDQEVPNEGEITLQGAGSDPDGDPIVSWAWAIVSAPAEGADCLQLPSPCLVGADSPSPVLSPPARGDYLLQLVVNDGADDSLPDVVGVVASNRRPLADATVDEAAPYSGETVHLDARGSSDPDGDDIVAWRWSVVSLPPAAVAQLVPGDGAAEEPTFRPRGKGSYFLSLVVTDSRGLDSEPALLRIDALNNPPTLDALDDVVVVNGDEVFVLARGADPDGDPLGYSWSLVDSPPDAATALVGANQSEVHFTPRRKTLVTEPGLCAVGQCYRLEVSVSDGVETSALRALTVVALNRAPTADAGDDQVPRDNVGVLDASGSFDPDADDLVSYTWTQVRGPDVTDGAGSLQGPMHSFEVVVAGIYEFDLVVSDGEAASAPDRVQVLVERINHPPTVSLASATSLALEGEPFALDASGSEDIDGDDITITWRRLSGNETFPAAFYGETPEVVAPSFEALIDSGDNNATYEVSASDGVFESEPTTVRLYSLPGPANWVIVSRAAGASEAANCGTLAQPCATLEAGTTARAGRDIVMTAHTWDKRYIGRTTAWAIPSNVRIVGGRHAATFARSTHSKLKAGLSDGVGIYLWQSVGVVVERIQLEVTGVRQAIRTTDAEGTFRDCVVISNGGCIANMEPNASRTLTFEGCEMHHTCGTTWCQGFDLAEGPGRLILLDTEAEVRPGVDDTTVYGARVRSGNYARFERSELRVVPNNTSGVLGSVIACPGTLHAYSSVFAGPVGQEFPVVVVSGETRAIVHNNVIYGGPNSSAMGLYVASASSIMGNRISHVNRPLMLTAAASLGSRIYGNSFDSSGSIVASCNGEYSRDIADLNADSGTLCNTSGAPHYGNIVGNCPMVDAALYDFRPDTGQANDCIDAGLEESPAGTAPELDILGNPRPDATSGLVDIGAYEVQPEP